MGGVRSGRGSLPVKILPPPETFLNPTDQKWLLAPPNYEKNIALAFLKAA
jgi:hypothetical protein